MEVILGQVGLVVVVLLVLWCLYEIATNGERTTAASQAMEIAVDRWAREHGLGPLDEHLPDPLALVPEPLRIGVPDRPQVRAGHWDHGRIALVHYLDRTDDELAGDLHVLLVSLEVPTRATAPPCPPRADHRRRWARDLAARLDLDRCAADALEEAAADVDSVLSLDDGRLTVLNRDLLRLVEIGDVVDHPRLIAHLDASLRLARNLAPQHVS